MSNQKGQSLVESLLLMPILMGMVLLIFKLAYLGLVFFYLQHLADKALICSALKSPSVCEQNLRRKARPILFFSQIQYLRISPRTFQSSLELTLSDRSNSLMRILPLPPFKIHKRIHLPLDRNVSWRLF
ncbi:MAG: TadE/TadG family type IV pilus assembly protein [Pseudobdellovibrionaceae bacterium]